MSKIIELPDGRKLSRGLLFNMGGGVSVLNDFNRSVTYEARRHGLEILASNDGLNGLLQPDGVMDLTHGDLRQDFYDRGSALGSTKESVMPDKTSEIMARLTGLGVDFLVFTGGDGTIRNVTPLMEAMKIPGVCGPKSSDNDVSGTLAMGYVSCIDEGVRVGENLRAAARTSSVMYVLQVMDNTKGHLPFAVGYNLKADAILTSQWDYNKNELCKYATDTFHARAANRQRPYFMVVMGEGVRMFNGHVPVEKRSNGGIKQKNTADMFAKSLQRVTGISTRGMNIAHDLRGAKRNPDDVRMAETMGKTAVQNLVQGDSGIVCLQGTRLLFADRRISIDGGEYKLESFSLAADSNGSGAILKKDPMVCAAEAEKIYTGRKAIAPKM